MSCNIGVNQFGASNQHRLIVNSPFSTRPIISYAFAVYALDTKRWPIVQRRHSAEFMILMRGLYRPTHLPFIIKPITKAEACLVTQCCVNQDEELFTTIYQQEVSSTHDKSDILHGFTRLSESASTILNILSQTDVKDNTLQWTWPKGRLQINNADSKEYPLECAKREFMEETGIDLPVPIFLSTKTYVDSIKTVLGRLVETRYWLYVIEHEIPMPLPDSNLEVADRRWASTEEVEELMHISLD